MCDSLGELAKAPPGPQNIYCYNTKFMTHKSKICLTPRLYFVTAVPSKTHTAANVDATCLIYRC